MRRNPSPNFIAFLSALSAAIPTGLLDLILRKQYLSALLSFVLVLFIGFFTFKFYLERFIYRKIKLIYKSIHRVKTQNIKMKNGEVEIDPISQVTEEVMLWAKDNRQQIESLRKQENYRREFLGNVSHELKTPITSIQGYIHTLLDGALKDADVNEKFLKKASKSLDRLEELVNDLVAISKLESGINEPKIKKFDIHALVSEIFDELEHQAQKRNISLYFKSGCDKPFFVNADHLQIKQVLTNLILNGINYGKEDGKVSASFYDMGSNLLIEIADNGEGIDQEHLPRLFERFYRIDKSRNRKVGGSGLGLAIVKHIIDAHNQTINVRSSIGKGTTFGFTLTQK